VEAEAEIFKSKAVSAIKDRNTETVNFQFFSGEGGILETHEIFPLAYFIHKPTCTYLPVFMGSSNM